MTCDVFDVVVVPFPFTDSPAAVRRPALVLSRPSFNRHGYTVLAMITAVRRPALVLSRPSFNRHGYTVLAMITDLRNAPWPLDTEIEPSAAGLKMASVVRMKFFTLDNRLI